MATPIQKSRNVSPEQKAIYHHVAGAGKSRIKRPFFDLSDADEARIVDRLDEHLDRIVAEDR